MHGISLYHDCKHDCVVLDHAMDRWHSSCMESSTLEEKSAVHEFKINFFYFYTHRQEALSGDCVEKHSL